MRLTLKCVPSSRFICHIHDYTESINQQWNVSKIAVSKLQVGSSGIWPRTSRTQSENHTPRPTSHWIEEITWPRRDMNTQPSDLESESSLHFMFLSTLSCGFGHRFSSTSSMAWRRGTCLWGAYWKPSTSMWRKTPQSGYSKERGVWG